MKSYRIAALLPALLLFLTSCGAGKPPESYDVGAAETIPALNTLVTLRADFQFAALQPGEAPPEETEAVPEGSEESAGVSESPDPSPEAAEEEAAGDGPVSYWYGNLLSGSQAAETYTRVLELDYSFVFLTPDGTEQAPEEPDFSAESGTVLVAGESTDSAGLFQVAVSWEETTCTVTPTFVEGASLPEKEEPSSSSMTLDEAVARLQRLPPAALGLEGEDMSPYNIFPEDGVAFLDGKSCICLNVYLKSSHQYQGTYLITGEGDQIYRLNRETGEAVPLDSQT